MRFLNFFLLIGIAFGFLSFLLYHFFDYSVLVLILWIVSILLSGIFFFKKNESGKTIHVNSFDIYAVLILLFIFIPMYLFSLYTIPFQVNTDEIVVMSFAKTAVQTGNDLLGINPALFSMPTMIFAFYGWLATLMGGVNLYNTRLIHACLGVLIILISYGFFRLNLPTKPAFGASLILGFSHSLLAISRMAMRDNSGLFIEILALFFLFRGLKTKSLFLTFLGGLTLGLSLYVYFVGRLVIIIWFLSLIFYLIFLKNSTKKELIKQVFACSLGFILVATPILISTFKQSAENFIYQKQQILLLPEGRKMQQDWIAAKNELEGLKKNIINGLTVFNNNKPDYAYIYHNPNHGFVDPLTGILVWVGVIIVILQSIIKRKIEDFDLLNLTGLFILLFIFSFISNKAPNYTRLLVILPFAAYFAIRGVTILLELTKAKKITRMSITFGILGLIIIWNLSIFYEFVQKGFTEGNDVGGTARYVEARKGIVGYKFYLSADNTYPYYGWGNEWQWRGWIGFFAGDNQEVQVLSPADFIVKLDQPPFTVFMSKILWSQSKANFIARYPSLQIYHIKPDGSLVAIEVK